ncbi:RNA polymerase sigma factor [Filimonas effusa]|uniref:RNA polymerase sigma factor n=1 Tax=Filimonas effusa TaxID=2508721 RepID=UPI0013E98700|nr:RNA polymerase sigma-70 factor [Filimonas effusa]
MSDEQLLLAIAEGHEAAFNAIFQRYQHKIYSYARHFTHDEVIAQDVVQEVFLRIWTAKQELGNIRKAEPWIAVLTRNICFNKLKKNACEYKAKSLLANHAGAQSGISEVEDYINYKDRLQALNQALQSLTPQQRKIYHLNRDFGLKNEEISRQLHLSPNTVKTHMVTALRRIRHFMESHPSSFLILFFLSI